MPLTLWANKQIKKLDIVDIKLIKIGVVAITLMIVALWPPLASLAWYWYLIIFILAYVRPMYKVFGK